MNYKKLFGGLALLLSGIIFGAVLVSGFGWVRPGLADINLGSANPPVTLNADATAFSQAFVEVAQKVTPSIVQITVVAEVKDNPHQDFFFPFKDFEVPEEQQGSGSGIIISDDGYVLTNNHVVENSKQVTVMLNDKRKFEAKVIGTDPLTDLAVIKINATKLPVAFLGNSDKLHVGQWVMAIGSPFSLTSTVTAGIISALNRGQLNLIQDSYGVEDFIQTDAAINPGNSGGALVDLSGAVIGINTAIASRTATYIGYGFAIPINLAKSVAKDLIASGKINRGYIGVQIREVDNAMAKALGLGSPRGVIVESLVSGGAAEDADVKRGDIILKIDNLDVNKPNQLQSYVASKSAGAEIILHIFRDGKEITRKVILKARKDDVVAAKDNESDSEKEKKDSKSDSKSFDEIGLTVRDMKNSEKETYNVDSGILITKVKPYSNAQAQGLGQGLVIKKIDKKPIDSVDDFENIVNKKKGSSVLLDVTDNKGNSRFVAIEIPE